MLKKQFLKNIILTNVKYYNYLGEKNGFYKRYLY